MSKCWYLGCVHVVLCSVSKQHAVIPSQVFELEDGSSSYKDFAMTRNNRFSSAGQASKNIIQPPSAVLHYYNVPPCISQEHLLRVRGQPCRPSSWTNMGQGQDMATSHLNILLFKQIIEPNMQLEVKVYLMCERPNDGGVVTYSLIFWQLCTEHDVPGFVKFKMFDAKRE